jgi:hypothetical protein
MANCGVCYSCQSGVAPTVSVEDFRKVKDAGLPLPKEWFTDHPGCHNCYSCQKCVTSQAPRQEQKA